LRNDPDVEYAELNYIYYTDIAPQQVGELGNPAVWPTDPDFDKQWGMHNNGINPIDGISSWGLKDADIDAPQAWGLEKGYDEVVVAVIDTGVDYNHPDLDTNIWKNEDEVIGDANGDGYPGLKNVDDDGDGLVDEDSQLRQPGEPGYTNDLANDDDENGFVDDTIGYDFCTTSACGTPDNDPMDEKGHGTHCAGIIGAKINNVISELTYLEGESVTEHPNKMETNYSGITIKEDNFGYLMNTSKDNNYIYEHNKQIYEAPSPKPTGIAYVSDGKHWISDPTADEIYQMEYIEYPVLTNKIRLHATKIYFIGMLGIKEFKIYNDNDPLINLALNATASASSGTNPEAVNDGDLNTWWITEEEPAWIELDFGEEVEIGKFKLSFFAMAVDFTVEVWDGNQWIKIFEIEGNVDPSISETVEKNEEINQLIVFPSPGPEPRGLDWDGAFLWNVDSETDKIYKLDAEGQVITSLDTPSPEPWGVLAWDNYLFVSDESTEKIYKLDYFGNVINEYDAPIIAYGEGQISPVLRGLTWQDKVEGIFYSLDDADTEYVKSYLFSVASQDSDEYIKMGTVGVCPNCKIMPVRAFNEKGWADTLEVAEAIRYAADNGAHILSNSWGSPVESEHIKNVMDYASQTSMIVAAAGNDSSPLPRYPAGLENVLSVAATDNNDELAYFSNYGYPSDRWVDVSAPGYHIYSTTPTFKIAAGGLSGQDENYDFKSGTSMACPFVAGLLGLVKSNTLASPEWDQDLIIGQVLRSADNIDEYNEKVEGLLGTGRINAYNALIDDPTPYFIYKKYEVLDSQGNDNGFLDPGETVAINLTIQNLGLSIDNIYGTLSTNNPDVSIITPTISYGTMATMDNVSKAFEIQLDATAPINQMIDFDLTITSRSQRLNQAIPIKIWVPYPIEKALLTLSIVAIVP